MANNLDYAVNLGGGTPAKKKQTSLTYSDNLLGGAIKDPRVPEAPPIPTPANLSYQGNMGGFGGVTDEGAIIGNPNVERMPYIREKTDTSYSANLMGKAVTSPVTPPVAMSYSAQQSTEQQAPTQQQENAPATGTGGGAPIDSYEEFLMKQEGLYKEQLDMRLGRWEDDFLKKADGDISYLLFSPVAGVRPMLENLFDLIKHKNCLLYTSPSPRD